MLGMHVRIFGCHVMCDVMTSTYNNSPAISGWPRREFIDMLLPYLTQMANASLSQGVLPAPQTHAIVTPLLKKAMLDTADMNNFQPVSNLTFMSKVVERAVSTQLNGYLTDNNLLPRHQSAYRKRHSTETAMLRIQSDALLTADGLAA